MKFNPIAFLKNIWDMESGERVKLFFNSLFIPIVFITGFITLGSFITTFGIAYNKRADYMSMIDGTAHKPFVGRILISQPVKFISSIVPDDFKASYDVAFYNFIVSSNLGQFNYLGKERLFDASLILFIMYLSISIFPIIFRKLLKSLYSASDLFYNVSSICVQIAVSFAFLHGSYFYDFLTLVLSSAFLYFIINRRWNSVLLTFVAFCFHKETSLILLLFFFIHGLKDKELPKKLFLKYFATMCAFFVSIRMSISYYFRFNPGESLERHFMINLKELMQRIEIPMLAALVFFGILYFSHWNEKPTILKRFAGMLFFMLVMGDLFGYVLELRQYFEIYPAIAALVCFSVYRFAGKNIQVISK